MNEGQESDYTRLRELGVSWSKAMDFTFEHPLGHTNIQHLRRYAKEVMEVKFDALKAIEEKLDDPAFTHAENLQAWAMLACAQQLKRLADQGNPVDHGSLTHMVAETYKEVDSANAMARKLLSRYEIREKK